MSERPSFDPYAVLGVERNATDAELRAAYRDLVARYHPDKHQGNPLEGLAAEKMAEINRAYAILSDRKRRADYDRNGAGPHTVYSTPTDAMRAAAARKRNSLLLKIFGILMLLPLLLRFGRMLIGALTAVFRFVFERVGGLRGTPFVGAAVALVLIILVAALLRRRSRRKSDG